MTSQRNIGPRLYITDTSSNTKYLVDTGADVSVWPAGNNHGAALNLPLFAANVTQIKTYGQKLVTLEIGLHRRFTWPFIVADVSRAIIGADFLNQFGLLVDIKRQRVVDPNSAYI